MTAHRIIHFLRNRHTKIWLSILLGLGLIFFIGYWDWILAKHKGFWGDEGLAINHTCGASFHQLVLEGAPAQSNKAPLYYILHKFVFEQISNFDQSILYQYRIVSLVASALCLLTLYLTLFFRLGLTWALLALVIATNQLYFHYFSAEDRPYMLWMSMVTVLICATAKVTSVKFTELKRSWKALFALSCFLTSLSAGPGAIQVSFALGLCFLIWRKGFFYLVTIGAISLALGLHYNGGGITTWGTSGDDLLATRNFNLVWNALALLFPRGSWVTWIFNGLAVLGILLSFSKHSRHKHSSVYFLSAATTIQLAASIAIGIFLAVSHYMFVPRVFIYYIACRALLVGCGGYFLVHRLLRSLKGFVFALVCIVLFLSLKTIEPTLRSYTNDDVYLIEKPGQECILPPARRYELYLPKKSLPFEFGENFIARFGYRIRDCARQPGFNQATQTVYILASPEEMQVLPEKPSDAVPLTQCEKKISILNPYF